MKENIKNLIKEGEGYNLEFKENISKNISKDICAFSNANGGKILLGVADAGKINGLKFTNRLKSKIQNLVQNITPQIKINIQEDINSGIVIVNIPEGKDKPYSANGAFYLRIGANSQKLKRDEIRKFFQEEGAILFDERLNKKFDIETDFNEDAYKKFLSLSKITDSGNKIDLLDNLNLLDGHHIKEAGVLLFCNESTRFIRSASITCVLFMGKDKYKILDRKVFNKDLYSNYRDSFEYVRSKLNTEYIIKDGPREEVLELPEDALREAILNAIAHRSYFSNADIQIYIFSDRVEIIDPGGLPAGITKKELGRKSMPRNTLLFGLMDKMDLIERAGSGIRRIKKEMKDYKLSPPNIEADENWFTLTLTRPSAGEESVETREKQAEKKNEVFGIKFGKKLGKKLGIKLGIKLNKNQIKIIDLISNNNNITIEQLSKNLNISTTAVEKNMSKLKKKGVLKRIGSRKAGHWKIIKDNQAD